jgi:hypothetical protein
MVKIGDKQRRYILNRTHRKIPKRITFRDPYAMYECDEEKAGQLIRHIKFTVEVLDKYIPGKYCAASGTLLAAYRHKGMMPWDSDADFLTMNNSIFFLMSKLDEINAINRDYVFAFYPMFGIKIYYKGYCYVDLIAFDFIDSSKTKIGYCSPNINGKNMILCSIIFANEVYHYGDIFPVKKMQFEDFEINCPRNSVEILTTNYSPKALTEIVFPDENQTMLHATFFNKIEAIPLIYKICDIFEKYPKSTKMHNALISFISYTMFSRYLSQEQKMQFAKCISFDSNPIGLVNEIILFNNDFELIQLIHTITCCVNNTNGVNKMVYALS